MSLIYTNYVTNLILIKIRFFCAKIKNFYFFFNCRFNVGFEHILNIYTYKFCYELGTYCQRMVELRQYKKQIKENEGINQLKNGIMCACVICM